MRLCTLVVAFVAALFATAADAKVVIAIDKSAQRMTVTVDGATRWTWPVSTGRRGHATPLGSFQAFRLEKDHFSKEWDDAPMPHSIFFTKRGHAIHGSYDTKRLGSPASAGCVRLHPDNAAQLFALVEERGVLNATVVITGEEPRASAPAVARQSPPSGSPTVARQTPPAGARAATLPPQQQPAPRVAPQQQQPQRTTRQSQLPPYDDPRVARPYRQPAYPGYGAPAYQRPQPGYEHLPPPPPGYMYAPPPPPGYYYYR